MSTAWPRTVITGIGVLTPIGEGIDPFWQSVMAGQSGVKRISLFDATGFPIRIAGEVTGFDAKKYIDKKDRKSLKMMARSIQMGVAVSGMALKDANLDPSQFDPTRIGIDFGASLIASDLDELAPGAHVSTDHGKKPVDMQIWGTQGLAVMPPLWMLKYLPNMPACHVSIMHNLQGPSNTITENDVAGLLSLAEAKRIIERGLADVMLTGASDSRINPLSLTRLSLFQQFTKRNDDPARACRPFDRERDGIIPGEGACNLILEELSHAEKRQASIYGEVVGAGAAQDRHRDGQGIARAIQAAMKQAGITAAQLDHINAHGYSHPHFDVMEAKGIRQAFGDQAPPVFAAKGYLGNIGSPGGPAELAISLLAMKHGSLPASLNYEYPDPECPLHVLHGEPKPITKDYVLKISFSDLGQCCAVVVKRWQD